MQIILTLEPIEILADLATDEIDAGRLATAAHDGIAEYLAARLRWLAQDAPAHLRPNLTVTVRPYVPITDGVESIEINPF